MRRHRISFELARSPFLWAFAVGAFCGRVRVQLGPWMLSAWTSDGD